MGLEESGAHASYLKGLPAKENCKHMKAMGVGVCTYDGECRYKGELTFSLSLGKVPECKRERVLRLMSIFKK